MEKYFGEWIPYSGTSAIILGVVLLMIGAVFTLFGLKLKNSLQVKMPGKATAGMQVVVWILSILTFFVNGEVYLLLWQQAKFTGTIPNNPITKFTLSFAFISFLLIFQINIKRGVKAAFLSAVLAAMAGPMILNYLLI